MRPSEMQKKKLAKDAGVSAIDYFAFYNHKLHIHVPDKVKDVLRKNTYFYFINSKS